MEQYITVLHRLADTCGYGDLKNEMIRDRLVVGIRDTAIDAGTQQAMTCRPTTPIEIVQRFEFDC